MKKVIVLLLLTASVAFADQQLELSASQCFQNGATGTLTASWHAVNGGSCAQGANKPGKTCWYTPASIGPNIEIPTTIKDQCVIHRFYAPVTTYVVSGTCGTPQGPQFYVWKYYWD